MYRSPLEVSSVIRTPTSVTTQRRLNVCHLNLMACQDKSLLLLINLILHTVSHMRLHLVLLATVAVHSQLLRLGMDRCHHNLVHTDNLLSHLTPCLDSPSLNRFSFRTTW
jgi:hypothetical protein